MKKGFDEYAEAYDSWFLENPNVLRSELKLVAHVLKDAGNILSVGCGSGLFEKLLRDEFDINITEGVEPSEGMAAIARKRGMNVTIATAEDTEFENGKYDTILFNGCPSYISDLHKTVKKVFDILPEGGRIILIDVPKESGYGILYNLAKAVGSWDHPLLQGCHPRNPYPIELVNQANWRTTAEKIKTLEEAGFKKISFAQTLSAHPLYSDLKEEDPMEGYDKGDYVAITGWK
ncbi:MAG: class I SAM-dependent methyltransferase [Muribaculaceae bacterium]|nr:class I SAM-dependent methyltransferase [Muribaculaceae bacterium]